MAEQDGLSEAKFGGGLFVDDFPVKIRVLTIDPLVYNDQYANTRYAFVVYNLDSDKVQILNKTAGFARRFQEVHTDEDFGHDIRKIDLKITTNGKQGKEIRYTITPVGSPTELTQEQLKIIKDSKVDLDKVIKKNNPNALRLSEVNAGAKVPESETQAEAELQPDQEEPIIEDIGDEPIDLSGIPF